MFYISDTDITKAHKVSNKLPIEKIQEACVLMLKKKRISYISRLTGLSRYQIIRAYNARKDAFTSRKTKKVKIQKGKCSSCEILLKPHEKGKCNYCLGVV